MGRFAAHPWPFQAGIDHNTEPADDVPQNILAVPLGSRGYSNQSDGHQQFHY